MNSIVLGGIAFEFDIPRGLGFRMPQYFPFLGAEGRKTAVSRAHIEILRDEIESGSLDAWARRPFRVDTGSTWALQASGDGDWPWHFGPSPSGGAEPVVPHALANRDFTRGRIYLGGNEPAVLKEPHLYPLDDVFVRHHLACHGGLLVHASGFQTDEGGILFLGDSGAGKSTIAGLFENAIGVNRVLSDDRIILRKIGGRWHIFGSPWHGTFPRVAPGGIELKALFFLEKEKSHRLLPLDPAGALERLLKVALLPWWVPELAGNHVSVLQSLIRESGIPSYRLAFAPEPSVVDFVLEPILKFPAS